MSGEVVVDALPYIDQGYDEAGVREAALAMVEEECRRYRPTKNYLEQLPLGVSNSNASFETTMLQREMERLNARLPPEPLSMKRYELPPPAAGRLSDATAWTEAVDNSHAQLEHQATRVMNLELQLEYSCETWRAYLEILQKMVNVAQNRLNGLRKETASVNWERKSVQTAIGSKLKGLEQTWVQLVSHNYSLERAIAELEQELIDVQKKNEEDGEEQKSEENGEERESEKKLTRKAEDDDDEMPAEKKLTRKAEDIDDEMPAEKKKRTIASEDMFAE